MATFIQSSVPAGSQHPARPGACVGVGGRRRESRSQPDVLPEQMAPSCGRKASWQTFSTHAFGGSSEPPARCLKGGAPEALELVWPDTHPPPPAPKKRAFPAWTLESNWSTKALSCFFPSKNLVDIETAILRRLATAILTGWWMGQAGCGDLTHKDDLRVKKSEPVVHILFLEHL